MVIYLFIEVLVNVVFGSVGLIFMLEVIKMRKMIVIVNKEIFVIVGYFVMEVVKEYGVDILLVDSEYLVIF